MNPNILLLLIISIVIIGYLFDVWLGYLNTTTWSTVLPATLRGIYDEGKYLEQQKFEQTRYWFNLVSGAFSFLLIMGMLVFNGFATLDVLIRHLTSSPILLALIFFGVLGLISDLLSTPFDIYDTFFIEQKFGFNTTTTKTYILDKLKGWLLAILLGGGILSLIVWIYEATGEWFWLLAWGIITFFTVFINYFYTTIILPIFNKLIPLPDGELKEAIRSFADKAGFNISNVFVIDGSKRSTRGNAYFSGFGKQKKIVLYDTLIQEHSIEELVAILAHEIGHYKKKHILKGLIISVFHTGFVLLILSFFVGSPVLSRSLGASIPSFHIGLIAFGILYSPISTILGLVMNIFSRRQEYEADFFAAEKYSSTALQQALKKLSVKNLSNLTPHPLYVFFNYSHPTLLQRLNALEKIDG
jgi:STE24 endopeptidase